MEGLQEKYLRWVLKVLEVLEVLEEKYTGVHGQKRSRQR